MTNAMQWALRGVTSGDAMQWANYGLLPFEEAPVDESLGFAVPIAFPTFPGATTAVTRPNILPSQIAALIHDAPVVVNTGSVEKIDPSIKQAAKRRGDALTQETIRKIRRS